MFSINFWVCIAHHITCGSSLNTNSTSSKITAFLRKLAVVTKNNLYTINTFYTIYTVLNVSKKLYPVLFESWHFPIRTLHVVVLIFTCSWFWPVQIELWLFSKELNAGAKTVKFNITINLKHPLSCIFLAPNASMSALRHTAELSVGLRLWVNHIQEQIQVYFFIYSFIFVEAKWTARARKSWTFYVFLVIKTPMSSNNISGAKRRHVNGLECSLNFSDLQHRFFCLYVIGHTLLLDSIPKSKQYYSRVDFEFIYWHLEQYGFLWLGCRILMHCASNFSERMKSTRGKKSWLQMTIMRITN